MNTPDDMLYRLAYLTRYSNMPRVKDESVAEHCFFVALKVIGLAKEYDFNVGSAVTMAIIHDLPEIYLSDMTWETKTAFPDLAVEVVSPSDTAAEVNAKVEEYLKAGTRLVWVVYPDSRSVMVYRSLREVELLREGDELDGRPVFEDFHVLVDELFR
ncbi:MAG: Uma2 family endonuclease [Chloroflexi bacterium]|nr:Uma2 family endonuclease [Chloroflexota bacterium]